MSDIVSSGLNITAMKQRTYGERLRALYIASANKDTVNEYRAFFDTLCASAFDNIEKNIKEGKPPIYFYNPLETDHGIILSSKEDERFNDPLFLILMKEYAEKYELVMNIKLASPVTNTPGGQPRPVGHPTSVIVISI